MAVRSAEINVMAASAVKVARALARDFIELEQLQASKAGSANFTDRSFNNGAGIMQETLIKARPERKVHMSGASTLELDKNDDLWLANPICGYVNFSRGIPHFSVAITHIQRQAALSTVIYDSVHNDLYWAEKGIGAYRNDRRIRVSQRRNLRDTIVGNYETNMGDTNIYKYQKSVTKQALNVRMLGSISLDLAYVAAGWLDGFWSLTAAPYDVIGGGLLVQEAGGFASGIFGTGRPGKGPGILASNAHLQGEFSALFRKASQNV